MPDLVEKLKSGFDGIAKAMTSGTQRLKDSTNVDSEISRSDTLEHDSEPAVGTASELIALGQSRVETSRRAFVEHHRDFYEGIAFYLGKQYQSWNGNIGAMDTVGSKNPDDIERFQRMTTNVVMPKIELAVARVLAAWPDAWCAPLTDSETDKASAQIGRSCTGHAERVTNLREQLEYALTVAAISTNTYLEWAWFNHGEADLGLQKPDGSIEYARLPVGEISNAVLLAIDAYPDPIASNTGDINDGGWFIKKAVRPISYIKRKWGKTPQATTRSENYGFMRQRLEWIAGDRGNQAGEPDATEVTEVWEKPSDQYRQGRYWVYAADETLLWAGWWPYEKKDRFPFVKVGWKRNIGSVWDLNMIKPLIDLQRQLNALDSYLYTRQLWDRPQEYIPDTANIAQKDLLSKSLGRSVPYTTSQQGGGEPKWIEPPTPGDFYFVRRKTLLDSIDTISGVRDFNGENAPAPNSTLEFQLRVQEEQTRLGPVIRRVGKAVVGSYEWIIALYKQYGATAPRMLGLDDKAIPMGKGAAAALTDLQGLRNGQCRIVLSEGSGIAKLPEAQEEKLQEFIKLMAQGVPSPVLEFYLEQSQWIRSDSSCDKLLANYKLYEQAQQAQAMALQQMKGNQANDQQQAKTQQEQQSAAIQEQAEQTKAAIQVHASSLEQTWRMQTDQANESQRAQNATEIENLKFGHAMELQRAAGATPNVSITAKAGSLGTVGIEKAAGLPMTDSVSDLKTMLTPPKPSAVKGNDNGKQPKQQAA